MADRLGARPWVAKARLGHALALLERDVPTAVDEANRLLREVVAEAGELGMRAVVSTAEQALTEQQALRRPGAGEAGMAPNGTDQSQAARNVFRREGEVWSLTFAGRTERVPATKGLRDLHLLLSAPGVDVPAVDLLAPDGGQVVRATKRMGGDLVLDEEARTAYRQRLEQLDELIEQAVTRHDDDRAAELDAEREALLDELRAATGLAGRPRRLGDEAERARKTVTARIRDTMRRLDEQHPDLAEHLRASITTGAACRYQPRRDIDWAL